MNKSQLIRAVSRSTGVELYAVEAVVGRTLAEIYAATKKGEHVTLRGFGTFKVVVRKKRLARNIRAGKSIAVPSKRYVKLVMSSRWKAQLNRQHVPLATL